jgi:hypothetical protein
MRINRAFLLKSGNLVVAGKETMRVIVKPEFSAWGGRTVARVTVADAFHRTHIFTHEEIESIRPGATA